MLLLSNILNDCNRIESHVLMQVQNNQARNEQVLGTVDLLVENQKVCKKTKKEKLTGVS